MTPPRPDWVALVASELGAELAVPQWAAQGRARTVPKAIGLHGQVWRQGAARFPSTCTALSVVRQRRKRTVEQPRIGFVHELFVHEPIMPMALVDQRQLVGSRSDGQLLSSGWWLADSGGAANDTPGRGGVGTRSVHKTSN